MINCKTYADEMLDSITGYGHLAVISVGDDPASQSYIKGKRKDCERVGFKFSHYAFPDGVETDEIISRINHLNNDPDVTGIIVQLPLPEGYNEEAITNCVALEKDVDGFRADSPFKPCTPEGIVHILKKELGDLTGKSATIIGRGKLVGKPLMQMLLDENMTVCVCHSRTHEHDMGALINNADAVIVAVGKPEKIDVRSYLGHAVVIDCGINRNADGTLCGDVGFTNCHRITPVPGGVGLLTRAMLMKHCERMERMEEQKNVYQ